jgi:hypothetical protein
VTFKINYRLAGLQYEYTDITVEAEDAVTLDLKLDELENRARRISGLYSTLDQVREAVGLEALNAAVTVFKDGLGATVLEEQSSPVVPAPEDAVQPIWERPPAPAAKHSGAVADTSVDDFDF